VLNIHTFFTSILDEGEWSASRLGRFNPGERTPGTHLIGSWVVPSVVLDAVANSRKCIIVPTGK
jgi:hypothetical protein